MIPGTRITHDSGTGKAIVFVLESGTPFRTVATETAQNIRSGFRSVLIEVQNFNEENWQVRARELEDILKEARIRFACVVAFGEVAALVQHLYLALPKAVRSLVLIDATTRPHPSRRTRWIGALEAWLPIGLPFRSRDAVFNGQPFLQRFRCPVLIISTSAASPYQRTQAEILLNTLPTAWKKSVLWSEFSERVPESILEFQSVAVKSPQRNRSAGGPDLAQTKEH